MKRILIIPNKTKDKDLSVSIAVAKKISSFGAMVLIEDKYETDLSGYANPISQDCIEADLIIVVGGDGSVIDASVIAIENDIPIIGINLGNIGYLAEIERDEIDLLERLFSGEYKIEKKMLLSVSKESKDGYFASKRLAVNDIILSHDTFLGISELSLTDSDGESLKYRADGLILSTPAGSTAYSLSAGGPIVSHDLDSIVATPICPHSFFNRSIIFKSTEQLLITNNGRSPLNISVDGRLFAEILSGENCIVKMAEKKLSMLSLRKNNMFSSLFGKMKRFENID